MAKGVKAWIRDPELIEKHHGSYEGMHLTPVMNTTREVHEMQALVKTVRML